MENIYEYTFTPDDRDRPVKMVYGDDEEVILTNDGIVEFTRKLSPMEVEKLLIDLFGTTKVGILDCSNMSDEEIAEIEKSISD